MAVITTTLERNSVYSAKLLPWLVCLSGGLLFFYESIQMSMFNALNTSLMASFHVNATQLGALSSVYFYTNSALIFAAGNLLDRFSTRRLILGSMTLCALGTLIFALAPTILVAAGGRFLVGVGGAFCFLSSVKLASRWFPPARMALIVGVIVTMYMFGGMMAQTPLASLVHAFGWRYAVFLDGLLGVVLTGFMWMVIKDRPKGEKHIEEAETKKLKTIGLKKSITSVLANPQNWYGAFYTSMMNFPVYLIGAFMGVIYLHQVDGLTTTQAATASSMIYFGSIFGCPIMGWLSDKLTSRRLPMILGAIIALAIVLPILYVHSLSFGSLLILFTLLGFITSSQVIGYPAVAEHNTKVLTGTAVSIVSMVTVFGGAVLLPFSGWLLDISGNHHVVNGVINYSPSAYHHAMLIMPLGFIGALIVAMLMKETHCKQKD